MLDDAIKKAIGVGLKKADAEDLLSSEIGNFLPIEYATEFVDLVREKNYARVLFRTITMPTATFEIPRIDADATVYYVSGEATAPAAKSSLDTAFAGKVTLVAKKLMAYTDISNEVEEDSKVAMLPLIKDAFAEGVATAEEKAMIQGDPALSWSNAQDAREAFEGVLKMGAAKTVDYATSLLATIEVARVTMGKYGRGVDKLIFLASPYTASKLRQETAVLTVEKYGPNATILKGELGQYMGIKLIESPYIPEELTVSVMEGGALTGADLGVAILMRRDAVLIGDRRKVKFESDKIIEADALRVVISERVDFKQTLGVGSIVRIEKLENSYVTP